MKTINPWGHVLRWLLPGMLAPAAFSYDILRNSGGQPITWNPGTVTMQVRLGSGTTLSDGTTYNTSTQAAMQTWNAVISTVQLVGQVGTAAAPLDHNGVNEIGFDSTIYGTAFDPYVLAVTVSYHTVATRADGSSQRTESDIVVNTAYTWDSYRGALRTAEDIRRVVMHELGHVLGLSHPDQASPPQYVTALMNSNVSDLDTIAWDDMTGAQSLYGALPVAPVFSYQPYSQTVTAGQAATFTAAAYGNPSPTYQWQRLPSGGSTWSNLSDAGIYSGTATTSCSVVAATTAMNGDQFRCVASNSAGNTNSTAVSLTVNAATPPSITNDPYNASEVEGEGASFYINASGSAPLMYRWQRLPAGSATWADLVDGGSYSATGTGNLILSGLTLAMSGDQYRCVVTNIAGSATSNAATLTVTPATPPSIFSGPFNQSVVEGTTATFYVYAVGSSPFSFQWQRLPAGSISWSDLTDGGNYAGSGSSYLNVNNPTLVMSGDQFRCTVVNRAGSVSSYAATLTVTPVVPPTITQQPVPLTVAKSLAVTFSVTAAGSQPLSYQWYKDGVLIPFATSSYIYIGSTNLSDAGNYTVTVTNGGGSVTSLAAELTVLPAILPSINSGYGEVTLSASDSYLLLYPNVTGTGPMAFQWFKDGVAIAGATSSSYYSYPVTAASAGVYSLQATNEAGLAMSADFEVVWLDNGGTKPWLDAVRLGDTIYFLAASPGRIMRYDLVQESWLPIVYLAETKVPTAFQPTPEGVFIAYGRELVKRTLDLQTETALGTSGSTINMMFSYGSLLYFQDGSNVITYDRSTLAAGPTFPAPYTWLALGKGLSRAARPVFSHSAAKGFTTCPNASPDDVIQFPISADGTITTCSDSPYHGSFTIGSQQYLSPDEQLLIDNSGVIYNPSDLTFAGSIGGAFDDLAFFADGTPVTLRGRKLIAHGGSGFAETGEYQLGNTGYALFGRNSTAYVFGAPPSNVTNPVVMKIASSSIVPVSEGGPGNPMDKVISVEDAFIDANDVIHLLSRSEQGIVRWDANSQSFLATIGLRGRPLFSSYAPAVGRLALLYGDGTLTDLFPVSDTRDKIFGYVPSQNRTFSFMAMDDLEFLNVQDAGDGGDFRMVLGAMGDSKYVSASSYWGAGQAWQSSTRRLYSNSQTTNGIEYITVPTSGILPTTPAGSANNIVAPLRFSSDGGLILSSNQRILNADLQQIGTIDSSVTDGVWLTDSFFTIRPRPNGTELQKWARITYAKIASILLPGIPLRIFQKSDNTVAVVSLVNGYLSFSLVASDLSLLSYSVNASSISGAPVIATQPSNQSVSVGGAVAFVVQASGTPAPTYQWQKNNVNIVGATGGSYMISSAVPNDAGNYRVVVTNSLGSTISDGAVLTVISRATSDFNHDGKPDLVWQNRVSGERGFWIMNGTEVGTFVTLATVSTEWEISGYGDFDGDGQPDLVWSNTATGERKLWLMNGTAMASEVPLATVGTEWEIAGVADFNGDGKPDIVWQNTISGQRGMWLMNGTQVGTFIEFATVGTEWQICATGDFNGDGKPDIVWQNTISGERGLWLMDGTRVGTYIAFATVGTEWSIMAADDFNGDGKTDIVWQNAISGERGMWLMNGTSVGTYIAFATVGTEWALGRMPYRRAPADFNADNQPDIIWSNTSTGERGFWIMNGTSVGTYIKFATVGTEWRIAGSADFNGDSKPDIIWENTLTGERGFWIMNGTSVGTYIKFATVGTEWRIAGSADFNADGKPDIIWENTVTGERGFWIMNGTSVGTYIKFATVGTEWRIAGSADFNGDSKPDIIWENTLTGERGLWIMNGISVGYYQSFATLGTEWELVGAADFNHDGKPDIIRQNTITGERGVWFMNGMTAGSYQPFATVGTEWTIGN